MAERIRERLEEEEIPLLDGSGMLKVTASFGTATMPLSAATVRQLFAAADDALYEAKRIGQESRRHGARAGAAARGRDGPRRAQLSRRFVVILSGSMGVFDDAIREHLELKRHAGADEDELKELEDEAFGPPARPGDPDFPGSTSEEAAVEAEARRTRPTPRTPRRWTLESLRLQEAPPTRPSIWRRRRPLPSSPRWRSRKRPRPASRFRRAPAATEPDSRGGRDPAMPQSPASRRPESSRSPAFPRPSARRSPISRRSSSISAPGELELGDLELDIDEEIEEVGGAVSEPLTDEEPLVIEEAFAEEPEAEVAEPPHEVEPEPEPPEEPPPLEPEPPGARAGRARHRRGDRGGRRRGSSR